MGVAISQINNTTYICRKNKNPEIMSCIEYPHYYDDRPL